MWAVVNIHRRLSRPRPRYARFCRRVESSSQSTKSLSKTRAKARKVAAATTSAPVHSGHAVARRVSHEMEGVPVRAPARVFPPDGRRRGRVTCTPSSGLEGPGLVTVVQEGQSEQQHVAVEGQGGADEGQEHAEEEDGARAGQDGHGGHHDGDLEKHLGHIEVGILCLEAIARRLQPLGRLLDLLLLRVVALLLLVVLPEHRLELLARLGAQGGAALDQIGLQAHLLAPVLMLADDLGLIEGPLIRRLLLGEEHLLGGIAAPESGEGEHHGKDGRDERHPPAEAALGFLVDLLGVRQLYFRHLLLMIASRPLLPVSEGLSLRVVEFQPRDVSNGIEIAVIMKEFYFCLKASRGDQTINSFSYRETSFAAVSMDTGSILKRT